MPAHQGPGPARRIGRRLPAARHGGRGLAAACRPHRLGFAAADGKRLGGSSVALDPHPLDVRSPPLARGKNPLELHWRLWPVGPLLPYDLPSCAALAADAVPMPWAGVELPVPGVPAQIITVAAAMTVDALAVPLRHWADLYHLRRRLTNEGEERLWEMAAAARMTDYLRILLGLVAELWPEVGPGAPPGAQSDTVRRIAWRRLVHMPCETRRASSLLLLWRRLHGAGAQLDPAWRDKLPPELRAGVAAELAGEVLTQAGTSFVAGSKLLRRTGLWLASPAERQALREELALAEVLWGLAG